jgi:Protein of unknown function (DUF1176)
MHTPHVSRSVSSVIAGLACLTLICGGAQAQTGPTVPLQVEYKHWTLVCDNVKTCTAYSLSDQSERDLIVPPRGVARASELLWVSVTRKAGPEAPVEIKFPSNPTAPITAFRAMTANGRASHTAPISASASEDGYVLVSPPSQAAFMTAGRSATHLFGLTRSGTVSGFASLSGMVAALRRMDEIQGRVGTTSALIDRGARPAATVLAAPASPLLQAVSLTPITQQPPQAVLTLRARDCEDADRYDRGAAGIEGFSAGRDTKVWMVPCGGGAYQGWSRFYIEGRNRPVEALNLPGPTAQPREEANSLTNPVLNPATGALSGYAKSRGIGDCGSSEKFQWTGQGFALVSLRQMPQCGKMMRQFWPSYWQADVAIKSSR